MRVNAVLRFAAALAAAIMLPFVIEAFRGGPPAGRTGAPGEPTCAAAGCHSGAPISNSNAIALEFGSPEYEPGELQRMTVRISASAAVFGFQASARTPDNGQAGSLMSIDATTQVLNAGSIQYVEHTGPRADGVFSFDWTPPATDIGPVTFYVAANAANNNNNPSGDQIHLNNFTINPAEPEPEPPRPAISENGIVHGATLSAGPGYAPNTFGTLFGTDIAERTANWDDAFVNGMAPVQLAGVKVFVNGVPAFLSFVGRGADSGNPFDQVNFIFPDDVARGDVRVEVETAAGRSDAAFVSLSDKAPAFVPFEPRGRRYLAAVMNDGSAFTGPADLFGGQPLQLPIRPARVGELVQLFGSGFGPTSPSVPAGKVPGVTAETVMPVTVMVGGVPAKVLFAGLSPFAGLFQIVIEVPELAPGDHELLAETGGFMTQAGVFLAVE